VRDESGQALVWMAVSSVALIAVVALAVDVGHIFNAQRELQASADAAALAGAQDLPNAGTATATAQNFSSSPGKKNAHPDLPNVSTTVTTKCLTGKGIPCNPVNTIVVQEQATVPMFFAKVLGINSVTIKAKSTASMSGGTPYPLDVMIVLDRTGSMSEDCSAGTDKMNCAKQGVLAFLGAMRPSVDKIGLAVLPPATSVGSRCNTAQNTYYDNSGYPYVIVPLSNDFRTSDSGPLNPSSNLVSTVNCLKAGGITAYAKAIDKAQAELAATGRPDAQDVIIFFTDGEANYGPWYLGTSSNYLRKPCQQAITSANTAKSAGTWVYTIAYATPSTFRCYGWKSSGSQGGYSCNTSAANQFRCDEVTAPVYAINTLKSMASVIDGQQKFYNQPAAADLTTIFERVAIDLSGVALIDDDST
jgi:Flp pilus assembly protein TadG